MTEIIAPGYTRVSEICSLLKSFSGISQEVLDNKKSIGSRTHEAIADYLNCLPQSTDEDCEGYFESFMNWFKLMNPEPVLIEKRFYNDEVKLTGAIDCCFRMPQNKSLTIVDWKTTASVHEPSWNMQAALYNFLVSEASVSREITHEISPNVLFIKLDKSGKAPLVKKYVIDSDMQEYAIAMMDLYDFMKNPRDMDCNDLQDYAAAMVSVSKYLAKFGEKAKIYPPITR